jgi:integrase
MIRRRGNRWQVTVYAGTDAVTGRERRVTRSVPAKPGQRQPSREARALEARLLVDVGAGEHRDAQVTVTELLDAWLEQAGPDLALTTLHGYQRYIRRNIAPALGNVRLDRLTTAMLDRLYRELRASGGVGGQPLSPATVRQIHAVLHRALGQAQRWGWINKNPAALASPPKLVRKEIRPPPPDQVGRILTAAREEDPLLGLAVWLAAVTGARRGEMCGIQWADLDLDTGTLVIRHSIVELGHKLIVKPPKTHQVRRIAVDDTTIGMLRTRHAEQARIALACGVQLDPLAYVLSESADGLAPLHPNLLSDRFRRVVRRLGVTCRLHDLRHWHVTQALGAGLPVRDVAERVGHASAQMTLDVYGHAISGADRRAAAAIADLLQGPSISRGRDATGGAVDLG